MYFCLMAKESKMTPDESLDLIACYMNKSRKSILRQSYLPFLIWGWSTIASGLAVYFGTKLTDDTKVYLIWFAIPFLAGIATSMIKAQNNIKTAASSSLATIWKMLTCLILSFSITSFFFRFNVLFCVLVLLAIGCFVTATLINNHLLQLCSVIGFVIAASMLLFHGTVIILLFCLAIFCMMIIPGYIMKNSLTDERT